MNDTKKITTGTKEWADSNVNCYYGCSNNCRYCYAKKMAIRFGRKTEENWEEMELNTKAFIKNYGKRKGRIMFPTSHDITDESLENCITVLRKLLKANNEVLVTSKPSLWIVFQIINQIEEFRDQVQFRFTITSSHNNKLKFWEPGAPNFEERLMALQMAYYRGYKTSISIEPFLDEDPIPLILKLSPYVSESIWLGKMNYITTNILPDEKRFYEYQRKISSWSNIKKILLDLQKLPDDIKSLIRLKDSIRNFKEYHTLVGECDNTPRLMLGDKTGDNGQMGGVRTASPIDLTKNQRGRRIIID